jgi:hydrogenase maturation protein HypF
LGVLFEMMGEDAAEFAKAWFNAAELRTLLAALERPKLFPRTSSLGRLFDAVAALCGLSERVTFEGQAAMALEFAVDPTTRDAYPLPLSAQMPAVADWEPLIHGVLDDRSRGVPVDRIAAKFHNALAEMALVVATRAGCHQIVLTGGCFQNAVLTGRVRERLLENDFKVYTHHQVPPGDGGIALGQVLIAAKRINSNENRSRREGTGSDP